jgi:hypothetical protein
MEIDYMGLRNSNVGVIPVLNALRQSRMRRDIRYDVSVMFKVKLIMNEE